MRRHQLIAIIAVLLFAAAKPAFGFHGCYRSFGFQRHCNVRSYARNWCYRPSYRSYVGYRPYVYRYNLNPYRYNVHPYRYNIHPYRYYSPIRSYVPVRSYYYYPRPYVSFGFGFCAQNTPAPQLPYSSYSFATTTTPTSLDLSPSSGVDINSRLALTALETADEEELPFTVGDLARLVGLRHLEMGDRLFRAKHYVAAAERYQEAADSVPYFAEAHFRQGHALIAAGQYDAAAQVLKRGLALDPSYVQTDFRLREIYGEKEPVAVEHMEALARAALSSKPDGDLLFLVGVFLHFDGQLERAQKFFQHANELTPGDNRHLLAFIDSGDESKVAVALR